ncbi:MAG: ABC transporter ATP-binding protein [Thermoleophilia bacterium]|nr:ABC transporter ATP-binding protein [Thermoleophilia bacterium]
MSPPAIAAEGLTKRYGRARGVTGVSLTVERGERFGFLGPNGAGKTTFIRLALGMLRPQEGRVAVMGHDLATDRMAALGEVGYLPGELSLYGSLTGRRTLEMLARLHPRPPVLRDELLEVLGLETGDLRRAVRQYSRGMKQKLGLVAALQHDPPLAILDEPTGGLDPVVQLRLVEWLDARSRTGMTVFFSSHVLAEVEALCDRVAMVRDGELLLVRDVSDLGLGAMRAVRVRFSEPVARERLAVVDGIEDHAVDGTEHRFTLTRPPGPLLAVLGTLPVADLVVAPFSLEDAVRTLYRPGAGNGSAA